MDNTTQEKLAAAEEALCRRFQEEELDDFSPEGLALDALRALRQEAERLEEKNRRLRALAAGILEAMDGQNDRRQAALARLGLESLAKG